MAQKKSRDPADRAGPYKRFPDVPDSRRLYHYASEYDGRDVWAEFSVEEEKQYKSDIFVEVNERAGREWKAHMVVVDRHHALATPKDVHLWCQSLLTKCTIATVHNPYWVRLEAFYRWLQNHVDHPHVYNPVLIAAATYEAAGSVWSEKFADLEGELE